MKKCGKALIIVIIAAMFSLLASGCMFSWRDFSRYDYHGDYPELYSVAINSILGARGVAQGEADYDSEITLIEEDEYGRVMYLYAENRKVSTYSLVIIQKSDDKFAYIYPDYNFISAEEDVFSETETEELKKKNDWGMEINADKCIKVEIVRKKAEGPVDEETLMQLYNLALGAASYSFKSSLAFLTTDDYGRSIYLAYGKYSSNRFVVLMFNPDGSYDASNCVMELTDVYNYQDKLKAFKEQNDWNQPYQQ